MWQKCIKMRITFIGMPGAGKTCMGRAIARKLKMRVVDGDKLIERRTGRKLQNIIDEDGLEAFKQLEAEILLSITDDDIIITPGGSAIYYNDVMQHFKENGIVVYLYVSPEVIAERIGDFSQRGVVLEDGKTLFDLYNERAPLFEKYADIIVKCDGNRYPKYQNEALKKINGFIAASKESK